MVAEFRSASRRFFKLPCQRQGVLRSKPVHKLSPATQACISFRRRSSRAGGRGSGIPPAAVILYAVSMTLGLMFLTREPPRGKTEGTHCQRNLRGHPQLFGLGRNVAPAGVAHFSGELRCRPRLSCLTFSVRIVAVIHFGCPAPPTGPQYHLLSIHVVYYLSLAAGFRPPRPRLSGVPLKEKKKRVEDGAGIEPAACGFADRCSAC